MSNDPAYDERAPGSTRPTINELNAWNVCGQNTIGTSIDRAAADGRRQPARNRDCSGRYRSWFYTAGHRDRPSP